MRSEQQLVDCAGDFNNNGCNGGLPSQAFEYIHYNGGLSKMEDYPYVCGDGKCNITGGPCNFKPVSTPTLLSKIDVHDKWGASCMRGVGEAADVCD